MNDRIALNLYFLWCLLTSALLFAGPTDDNHVHVEQVADGDDIELNITQVGFANSIEFSFAHSGNVFNLQQHGNGK